MKILMMSALAALGLFVVSNAAHATNLTIIYQNATGGTATRTSVSCSNTPCVISPSSVGNGGTTTGESSGSGFTSINVTFSTSKGTCVFDASQISSSPCSAPVILASAQSGTVNCTVVSNPVGSPAGTCNSSSTVRMQ